MIWKLRFKIDFLARQWSFFISIRVDETYVKLISKIKWKKGTHNAQIGMKKNHWIIFNAIRKCLKFHTYYLKVKKNRDMMCPLSSFNTLKCLSISFLFASSTLYMLNDFISVNEKRVFLHWYLILLHFSMEENLLLKCHFEIQRMRYLKAGWCVIKYY